MNQRCTPILFFSSLRNRFQLVLFLMTLAIGLQFYFFVEQAGNGGPITIQRPAGVEGFLPIGALLGWKQLLTTGIWDPVHPAAMVILLYAAVVSLLFENPFAVGSARSEHCLNGSGSLVIECWGRTSNYPRAWIGPCDR